MKKLQSSNHALKFAIHDAELSHQRLTDAVESISESFALFDKYNNLVLYNKGLTDIWGIAGIAVSLGMNRKELLRHIGNITTQKQTYVDNKNRHLITVYQLNTGRWIQISEHPTSDGGVVILHTDITGLKHEEKLRRESELKEKSRVLQITVDNLSQGVALVGSTGRLEVWNKAFLSLTGLTQDVLKAKPFMKELLAICEITLFTPLNCDRSGKAKTKIEQIFANGTVIEIRTHATLYEGYVNTYTDITERYSYAEELKQAYDSMEQRVLERTMELSTVNQQLRKEILERKAVALSLREAKKSAERANLSKTKFLAAASHDLQQPLNAARLFTGALLDKPLTDDCQQLASSVGYSLDVVESLLETLVDISRLDAGVVKPDMTSFYADDLLDSIANEYRQISSDSGLSFSYIPSTTLIHSDSQLLARIIRNFLTNAVRYTKQGRIVLGSRRRDNSLLIQIWDTGSGIQDDELNSIFVEFQQLKSEEQSKNKGLGLGLAIVDRIAKVLGHTIQVSSVYGKGSVFSVEVPIGALSNLKSSESQEDHSSADKLKGANIWIMNYDSMIGRGMFKLISGWGSKVLSADSIDHIFATTDTARDNPDIIVFGYEPHGKLSGPCDDWVTELKGKFKKNPKILVITSNDNSNFKEEAKKRGCLVMNKPIRPMRLKTTLLHLLNNAPQTKVNHRQKRRRLETDAV